MLDGIFGFESNRGARWMESDPWPMLLCGGGNDPMTLWLPQKLTYSSSFSFRNGHHKQLLPAKHINRIIIYNFYLLVEKIQ
jgi:hypothetical protein